MTQEASIQDNYPAQVGEFLSKAEIALVDHGLRAEKAVSSIIASAEAIIITNEDTAAEAVDVAKQIKTALKRLDERRKEVGAPFKSVLDKVNNTFNAFRDRLQASDKVLIGKIGNYQAQVEKSRREQAEQARLAHENDALSRAGAAEASGDHEKAEAILNTAASDPVKAHASGPIRGDFGAAASGQEEWRLVVTDPFLIDRKLLRAVAHDGAQLVNKYALPVIELDRQLVRELIEQAQQKDREISEISIPGIVITKKLKTVIR